MKKAFSLSLYMLLAVTHARAQTSVNDGIFKIALPARPGQLQWHADGFTVTETSAKPSGNEIGLRGVNASGQLRFLGFLFVVPGQASMTGAKCRDGILDNERTANPTLKVINTLTVSRSDQLPVEVVHYSLPGRNKSADVVRAFVATGEVCGDLEIYGDGVKGPEDQEIRQIVDSLQYDRNYIAQFRDLFLFAQILYQKNEFSAAAPIFESAITKLKDDKALDQQNWRRIATDQMGIAYGASGNIKRARAVFEAAIKADPDFPLYYYNLACADAEEKKLSDARTHLEQAFARKKNMLPGESMPDPTKDDSFLPYQNNKEFWTFLKTLR